MVLLLALQQQLMLAHVKMFHEMEEQLDHLKSHKTIKLTIYFLLNESATRSPAHTSHYNQI